jgi:hypothetical protein
MPTCHIQFANYLIIKQLMRVFEYIIIFEWVQIKLQGLINQSFTIELVYLKKTGKCVKVYFLFCFFI